MDAMTTITFRIEQDLKTAFEALCLADDITGSQLLRAAVRQYVADRSNTIGVPVTSCGLLDACFRPAETAAKHAKKHRKA